VLRASQSCQYVGELPTLEKVLAICFSIRGVTLTPYSGYDLANQTTYLDDMLRWSLDWLIKVNSAFMCLLTYTYYSKGSPKPAYTLYTSGRRYQSAYRYALPLSKHRPCTGNLDNAYWGGDLNIPQNRPSYQINDTR
jgi:endoglucanase